jgi:quinol-cytochrome oxidoreductase complex cytochrome b subunit
MTTSQTPSDTKSITTRIRRSIFADPIVPKNESERKRFLRRLLLLHFRPATVSAETLRFSLTWGLGGMAVVLVLIQLFTGILLKFAYEPTTISAYQSIQKLMVEIPFGRLIRNLHHWCAHLLVFVIFLHILRVFFTGAFHAPRQFNWVIGLCMLATILGANFTGYLLPWDQLAYWAVTISAGMLEYWPWVGASIQSIILDGTEVGPATLRFFFAVHTTILPAILILLMGFHFWRIRKVGGLVIPRQSLDESATNSNRVATIPHLLLRETVVAATLIAVVILWSVYMDAPLADPANPGLSPNPTKAPWYFAGLQEMIIHFHPVLAVCILPLLFGTVALAIPYLSFSKDTSGVWFVSSEGRKMGLIAAAIAMLVAAMMIVISEKLMVSQVDPQSSSYITSGLLALIFLAIMLTVLIWFMKKHHSIALNESVQSIFISIVTIYIVLTIVNVWFRGAGMALSLSE